MKVWVMVAILSLACVSIFGCRETYTYAYGTIEEAEAAGVVSRGWVPSSLPRSASEINVRYELDSNEVWGRFSIAGDREKEPSQLNQRAAVVRELDGEQRSFKIASPGRGFSWPAFLRGNISSAELNRLGYRVFVHSDNPFVIVINRESGLGFFWAEEAS